MASVKLLDKVLRLCERRGFLRSLGSEISFGPLGIEMKRNLLNEWWMNVVTATGNMYPVCSPSKYDFNTEKMSSSCASKGNFGLRGHLLSPDACSAVVNRMEPSLPYGLAEVGKVFKKKPDSDCVTETEIGTMKFLCNKEKVKHFSRSWCRRRLLWWENFSNNSNNFEKKEKTERHQVIQFKSEDGEERVLEEWWWEDSDPLSAQHSSVSISTMIDEAVLAFLCDSYKEDLDYPSHEMLQLHFSLAPYKLVVLSDGSGRDVHRIDMYARKLADELRFAGYSIAQSPPPTCNVDEELQLHDEIGTVCRIVINDQSLQDGSIKVVNRDTAVMEYLKENEILDYLLFRHKLMKS